MTLPAASTDEWLCTCELPVHMAGTTSTAQATAGYARRTEGRGRDPMSTAAKAVVAATAPRPAQMESAHCGLSATSSPSIHEMPEMRVSNHPPTAAPLMSTPAGMSATRGASNMKSPQPTWSRVITMKMRASCGCSACRPMAPPWMTPAANEANPAMAIPG